MPPGPSPITSAPSPDSSAPGQATSSAGTDDGSHVRRSPDQERAPAADPDHAVLLRTQRQGGVAAELGGAGEDLGPHRRRVGRAAKAEVGPRSEEDPLDVGVGGTCELDILSPLN